MSYKTSFKRVALVAVAALTIGGFSAVSAHAATPAFTGATLATGGTSTGTVTSVVASFGTVSHPSASTWTSLLTLAVTGTTLGATDAYTVAGSTSTTTGTATSALGTITRGATTATTASLTGTVTFTATGVTAAAVAAAIDTYAMTLTVTGANVGTATAAAVNVVIPTTACVAWTVKTSGLTNSINLKEATANTDVVNTSVSVNLGANLLAQALATDSSNCGTQQFSAYLSTYPASAFTAISATTAGTPTAVTGATTTVTSPNIFVKQTTTEVATTAMTVTSSAAAGIGAFAFTPTKAGTYVLTVWNDVNGDGTVQATEAVQTMTITVTGATSIAPLQSIVRSAPAGTTIVAQGSTTDGSYTAAINANPLSGSATAGNAIGQVEVILLNTDLTAATNAHTVSVTVSGSGLATVNLSGATVSTGGTRAATLALTSGQNIAVVHLMSDGTSGSGTVTISVTDSVSGATTVIGTKSFTSYGAVTKIVATPILSIGTAGGGTTGTSAATPTLAAFTVAATDALGNPVTGLSISAKSSDITVVNSAITITADDGTVGNGNGQYNGSFSTALSAVSGKTATLTIRVVNPADTTTYLTSDLALTIGGSVAKEVMTTDKASYAPGDAMIITITATDAAGNPVADGKTSPTGISSNKSVIGLPTASSTYKAGVKVYKTGIYAPSVSGPFILTTTSTNAAGDTITATATVTGDTSLNASIQAALDAANAAADAAAEATDAANAATDAANAAADAADSATAAAQDAADQAGQALAAVNTLATSVAVLVAGIKAQITSVTNLVIKLIKKVATLPKK
jgi:hypothetical protein